MGEASSLHQPTQKPPTQTPWTLSKMNTTLTCISDRKEICPQLKRAYDQGWLEEEDGHDQQQKPPSRAIPLKDRAHQ
jgi:hypothetical protein